MLICQKFLLCLNVIVNSQCKIFNTLKMQYVTEKIPHLHSKVKNRTEMNNTPPFWFSVSSNTWHWPIDVLAKGWPPSPPAYGQIVTFNPENFTPCSKYWHRLSLRSFFYREEHERIILVWYACLWVCTPGVRPIIGCVHEVNRDRTQAAASDFLFNWNFRKSNHPSL